MPIELKPCPFCGGEAAVITKQYNKGFLRGKGDYTYIRCKLCHATSTAAFTKEEAEEAWNRRVDDGGKV